jgi:hypothetical protein
MWKQLSRWLNKVSTGRITLIALGVFVLFSILVLPGQSRGTDQEVRSPDLSLYYSADELYEMAEMLGEQGRVDYIHARFTFDLIWPLIYTFFLATSISWIYQRIAPAESYWRLVNLLPLLGMVGDYLENIATSIVMWQYPVTTPILDWMAGIFTTLKWFLIGGSFASLVLGGILLIWPLIKGTD